MSSGTQSSGGSSSGPHLVPLGATLTPKSLLKRHKLPTAAHLHTPTAPPGLDLSRPLLLYKTYTSTKVRGVSLRPGRDGSLTPVGPSIVIPDSYTGWFAVVTPDGHTAPYYSTVEQVAASKVSFFLTRYDVPAYTNLQDADGRVTYQKTVVSSGHVLKLLGIFEDLNAKRNSSSRIRDTTSVFTCDKYAQCLNYRNETVFLPFSASGRFYTTSHKSSKNPNHVCLMAHILKNHKLPITVRLVCGYMPRVPCNFTGLLRLEQAQKEAVILACTMTNEADATLFEIDVASNFVLTPVKDPLFPKSPIFLKTISYCEDEADAWRRQIKVTHHVTEKRSRSLSRSLSDKFVEAPQPSGFAFLADLDKKKIRGREKSCDRTFLADLDKKKIRGREKSRDRTFLADLANRGREKSRDRIFLADLDKKKIRGREKSRDRIDMRVRERKRDKSRDLLFGRRDQSQDNILGSRDKKIMDDSLTKLGTKGQDVRKLSKQNTYIFQQGYNARANTRKQEVEAVERLNRSIENLDYSNVVDDISPVHEGEGDEGDENHYTEICDYRNPTVRCNERPGRQRSPRNKENVKRKIAMPDGGENNLSFTLLKKDIGGYYVKMPGFDMTRDDGDFRGSPNNSKSSDSLC